jgi:acyl CoA:acetate/3-ketoacid CoA transferase alpha subunit
MISRNLRLGLLVGLLCTCGIAKAQEMRATIDKGNALACRNKGDIELALEAVLQGQQAWNVASASLLLSGACTELKRGTSVTVLEVTRHSRSAPFNVARVRPAGDRNEHYVNAMYVGH